MKKGFLNKDTSKENCTKQNTVRARANRLHHRDVTVKSQQTNENLRVSSSSFVSSEDKPLWAKRGFLERGKSSKRKSGSKSREGTNNGGEHQEVSKTSPCNTSSARIKERTTIKNHDDTSSKRSIHQQHSRTINNSTRGGEKSTLWKKGFLIDSRPKEISKRRGNTHGPKSDSKKDSNNATLKTDTKLKRGDSTLLLLEQSQTKTEHVKESSAADCSLLFLDHSKEENNSQEDASGSRALITDVTFDEDSKSFHGGVKPNLFHIIETVDGPMQAKSLPMSGHSDHNLNTPILVTENLLGGDQDCEEFLCKPISSRKKVNDMFRVCEEEEDKKDTKEGPEKASSEIIDIKEYAPTLQTDLSIVLAKLKKEVKSVRTSLRRQRVKEAQGGNDQPPLKKEQRFMEYPLFLTTFLEAHIKIQGNNGSICCYGIDGPGQYEKQMSLSKLRFIWNCILESIASHTKDKMETHVDYALGYPPPIVLGMCILNVYPSEGLVALLEPVLASETLVGDKGSKRLKTQILGTAFVLKIQLRIWIDTLESDLHYKDLLTELSINRLTYLLDKGLSLMTNWVLENDGVGNNRKRTLLKQTCMDSSFLILEYASLYCQRFGSEPLLSNSTTPLALWHTISVFRKLLKIKKDWILGEKEKRDVESISYQHIVTKDCETRILNDWLKVLSLVEKHHNHVQSAEGTNIRLVSSCLYANELAGVLLQVDQKPNSALFKMRFGGVAQTLCRDYSERCPQPEDVQSALRGAIYFMENRDSSSNEGTIDNKSGLFEGGSREEIPILRGLTSWLSKKKFLKMLLDFISSSETNQAGLSEELMLLLRSRSERCLNFVEVILNGIWSGSNGLPPDFDSLNMVVRHEQCTDDCVPKSFTSLLKEINRNNIPSTTLQLEPSEKVLCALFERLLTHKLHILLPYYLRRIQMNNKTIHVLILLLKKHGGQGTNEKVAIRLIGTLEQSRFLQQYIHGDPSIFTHVPLYAIFPKLLLCFKKKSISSYAKSALAHSLNSIFEERGHEALPFIIDDLLLDEKACTNNESLEYLKYAESWRKAIFGSRKLGKDGYKNCVIFIANAMFENPSSSACLIFFGAMTSNSMILKGMSEEEYEQRLSGSVVGLLEVGLKEIERVDGHREQKSDTFSRLSPLLMLRRIPVECYHLLHKHPNISKGVLQRLANNIYGKVIDGQIYGNATPDEKRLLAEIGATCLPFSGIDSILSSTYDFFCKRAFEDTTQALDTAALSHEVFRRAKVSLYLKCHSIQIAPQDASADGASKTTIFALRILSSQSEEDDDDLVQMQMLCIEYFSTCILSLCAKTTAKSNPSSKINEIEDSSLMKENPISQNSLKMCLSHTCSILLQIALCEKVQNSSKAYFQSFGVDIDNAEYGVSCRVCLFNALTLASQKCSSMDRMVNVLSKMFVPDLLQWLIHDHSEKRRRHPLCIAAAIQFTFNVLTMTKSILTLNIEGLGIKESVRQIFRFLISVVNMNEDSEETYAVTSVRICALKMLVSIVTIDQIEDENSLIFSPGDLSQTFSILKGAGNIDENAEVRKLASHVLTVLKRGNDYD